MLHGAPSRFWLTSRQVGYESEFVLLEPRGGDASGALRPVSGGQYCQTKSFDEMSPSANGLSLLTFLPCCTFYSALNTNGLRCIAATVGSSQWASSMPRKLRLSVAIAVLDEMCDALEQMKIAVMQLHAEAGEGQFEIVTGHSSAMQISRNIRLHPSPSSAASHIPLQCRDKAMFLHAVLRDVADLWHARNPAPFTFHSSTPIRPKRLITTLTRHFPTRKRWRISCSPGRRSGASQVSTVKRRHSCRSSVSMTRAMANTFTGACRQCAVTGRLAFGLDETIGPMIAVPATVTNLQQCRHAKPHCHPIYG